MPAIITCPRCGREPIPTMSRYGMRRECCGLRSWGDAPLVSPELLRRRVEVHRAIDPLWKLYDVPRREVYKAMAEWLQIDRKDCHVKLLSMDQCDTVIRMATEILRLPRPDLVRMFDGSGRK